MVGFWSREDRVFLSRDSVLGFVIAEGVLFVIYEHSDTVGCLIYIEST